MPAKKSLEFYAKIAEARGGGCLSTVYLGSRTQYEWFCKEGHVWPATATGIQRGFWCPFCDTSALKNVKWLQMLACQEPHPGGKCLSTEYGYSNSRYEWQCEKNHRPWFTTANKIQQGRWCKYCSGKDRKNVEWLRALAAKHNGQCLSHFYKNSKTKYQWQCDQGHQPWFAKADNIGQGKWCPHCTHRSKPEQQIFEFIKSKFPDAQNRTKGILKNKRFELDIYVPSLHKAIEYDGDRWHSKPEAIERDARKNAECVESGIQLLRIRESDFIANEADVFKRIQEFLCPSP